MRVRSIIFWGLLALLLLPAVALTLVRIADLELGWAIQAQAFTPFALPVYAVALLLLLGGAVVRSGRRRSLLAPAVLALVGLGLHAWWFSPQVVGERPVAQEGADSLTVMTANLYFGGGDAVELVEQASEEGVDVLVVNEITERGLRDMESVGLDQLFPHRAGDPGESIEGTMVFSREEIEVVQSLDTPMASLAVETGGVDVLAVHPSPPTQPELWVQDLAIVLDAANELDPDVILGDFNATPDHAPMRALADAGYRDSVELANAVFQPTWPANGEFPLLGLLPPSAPIDHVLLSDELTVVETGTTELAGTDHRPVVVEVARR